LTLRIDVHLFVHNESTDRVNQALEQLLTQGDAMSAALDKITAEVTETKGIIQSAVTLIEGLAQQIRDLKDDPAALDALTIGVSGTRFWRLSLDTDSKALADAVAANAPTTPTP